MPILPLLIPIIAYLLLAVGLYLQAPWWTMGLLSLPTILLGTGWGFSLWIHRNKRSSPLQLLIDSAWISLLITWLNIALVRELGFGSHEQLPWLLYGISLLWTASGLILGKNNTVIPPLPPRERYGLLSIFLALVFLMWWKAPDIARPLDGHWFLEQADDPRHPLQPIRPANGWRSVETIGWAEAGAFKMLPSTSFPTLISDHRTNGRITLAVRGPLGSYIEANGTRNTVAQYMAESEEEGGVRRYLDSGVAAISIWADLQPGDVLPIKVEGDEVYLLASSDAVWSLHAEGDLRYTFYYQILNQVENQVWAEECLEDRRFTWNQPPGWSPILAFSNVMIAPDLNGAACLFLYVLFLVALSSLRLISIVAPRAQALGWTVPALLMLSHANLMLEPASHNFPDSLYAAAVLGILIGLFSKESLRFGILGVATQALRWPGAILGSGFLILYAWREKISLRPYLKFLWIGTGVGVLATGLAFLLGDAEDLLFILYFETFPEHWHGDYNLWTLLSRYPMFYKKWTMYTGGMLLLSLPFLWNKQNKSVFTILGGGLAYSLLLASIDHDPSHYFLPLVALTGPAFVASSTCIPNLNQQKIYLSLGVIGVVTYLWIGIV